MSDRLLFDFDPRGASRRRAETSPMKFLLLADFSGRACDTRPPLAERRVLRVDLDNFDQVFTAIAPQINFGGGQIQLTSIDDFHPDALFDMHPLFKALREARTRPAPQGSDSPLGALLGKVEKSAPGTNGSHARGPSDTSSIEALIERAVAPHIVPNNSASTQAYLHAVDSAIAEQMRTLLHQSEFQTLEANWQGVQWLLNNLELDEQLQLHVFDVSRQEIESDVSASTQLEQCALYQALNCKTGTANSEQAWSALIGQMSFGNSTQDAKTLGVIGKLGASLGGSFIASAEESLWAGNTQCSDITALRTSEISTWLGLVAPRLLLRRPYGRRSEPVSAFAFEELGNSPQTSEYLWGSGALVCAALLGRSFSENEGWSFRCADQRNIEDLPACTRLDADGEPELVPCGEQFLSDTQAEALLAAGLMPLLSHRHANSVQLMRYRSFAASGAPLQGLPD